MVRQMLMAMCVGMGICESWAMADLIVAVPGQKSVVDFASFTGAGFSADPASGQLDSTTWRVGGFTDGTLSYGGTGVTGDFARGKSSGGVTSGGLYAFQVASGDWAMGVQATGTDFNPGFFELRILNRAGAAMERWGVGYDLYTRNDQARSSSWDLAWSLDGSTFTTLADARYVSPTTATSTAFEKNSFAWTLPITVPDAANLYLRWTSADYAGLGSRDEFALDNVSISGVASVTSTPEPSTLVLTGVAGAVLWGYRRLRKKPRVKRG